MADIGRSLISLRNRAVASLLAWLASVSGLAAAAPSDTPAEPEVSVHFTVFSAIPISGIGFQAKPDASPTPVVFYPTARSPRYEYVGTNPLRFQSISVAGANGVTADEKSMAEVTFGPNIHEAFLLFEPMMPPAKDGVRYRVYVLDDSAVRQGPGMLTLVNLSGLPLNGSAGKSFVNLRDTLVAPFMIGRSAKVTLRVPYAGRSYQAFADTIDLEAGERALLILFPPFRAGSLEVQSRLLIDKPAEAEPAKR